MRWFLSQTLVKWFKQIGVLGWIRFRILRIGYKIFWPGSPRNGEWDFILQWMRPLRKFQGYVSVLDVGVTESLLIYELAHRGYKMTGLDQRPYQEKLPFKFLQFDLTSEKWLPRELLNYYDYIIAISTVEHIGLGAYADNKKEKGDKRALYHLIDLLKPNGYLIITMPNKHLGTDTGRGYSYQDFERLIRGLFRIVHFEERSNQICAVLCRL